MAGEQMNLTLQVAGMVVPAAAYFLLLGLFNSRPTPQLVSARRDFLVLVATFCPALFVPVLAACGGSPWAMLLPAGVLVATAFAAPRRGSGWVVYNVTQTEALAALQRALRALGEPFARRGQTLALTARDVTLRVTAIALLRNASISAAGTDGAAFAPALEQALGEQLSGVRAQTAPMATAFLLIATAMLVTPLGLFANRMPEMVRIISDLVR